MPKQSTTKPGVIPVIDGVMVLYGCRIAVKVEKGFLSIVDGYCDIYRHSLLSKATCKLKRLVLLGDEGYITLAALEWLFKIKAGIIQIGWDGEIILASGPHREHITIKRAQYAAVNNSDGLEIARYLMAQKLQGQSRVLNEHAPDETFNYQGESFNTARFIKAHVLEIEKAGSISEILGIEALTSGAYHNVILKTRLSFEKKEREYIPPHWLTFGTRHSLINTHKNRNAVTPGNAMLNYLFALLNSETCIALLGVGLDPYAGIFHRDVMGRTSFAYDAMEPIRPAVEGWLLDFVSSRVFSRKEFYQTPAGGVRLSLDFKPVLAATVGLWSAAVLPHVERVVGILKRAGPE